MQLQPGQVAVITGGASGIGLALAHALCARGLAVSIADVRPGAVEQAVHELRVAGRTAVGVVTDVTQPAEVDHLAEVTLAEFGRVDLVCNNAGVAPSPRRSWEQDPATWRWVVDVTLLGVANGVRTFVPRLLAQGSGHVLNTASVGGLIPLPMLGPYGAAKAAVISLTETLAVELRQAGSAVVASVLCPGFIETPLSTTSVEVAPAGATAPPEPIAQGSLGSGAPALPMDAAIDAVLLGLEQDQLHIFTHALTAAPIRARVERLLGDLPL